MEDTKTCTKCKVPKLLGEFYLDSPGGAYQASCKECTKIRVRQNYNRRREKYSRYERKRQQTPERRAKKMLYMKKHRENNPEKYKARHAVSNALRDGRLTKLPCTYCGTTIKVQAHHSDYSKPLEVTWTCFSCHRQVEHGQTVTAA